MYDLLNEIEEMATDKECEFICEKVKSKAVPQPKLLIKDHKKPDLEGNFPTRFVVPAQNFMAGFPKLGYKGIQQTFEENGMYIGNRNLVQASELKEDIKDMEVKSDRATIASVNAVEMYPSIKYGSSLTHLAPMPRTD